MYAQVRMEGKIDGVERKVDALIDLLMTHGGRGSGGGLDMPMDQGWFERGASNVSQNLTGLRRLIPKGGEQDPAARKAAGEEGGRGEGGGGGEMGKQLRRDKGERQGGRKGGGNENGVGEGVGAEAAGDITTAPVVLGSGSGPSGINQAGGSAPKPVYFMDHPDSSSPPALAHALPHTERVLRAAGEGGGGGGAGGMWGGGGDGARWSAMNLPTWREILSPLSDTLAERAGAFSAPAASYSKRATSGAEGGAAEAEGAVEVSNSPRRVSASQVMASEEQRQAGGGKSGGKGGKKEAGGQRGAVNTRTPREMVV